MGERTVVGRRRGVSSADLAAYFDTRSPLAGGDFDPAGSPETRIMYVGEPSTHTYHRRMYDDASGGYVIDGRPQSRPLISRRTLLHQLRSDTTVKVYTNGTADPDDTENPELVWATCSRI